MKTCAKVVAACILLVVACDNRIDNAYAAFTNSDADQILNAYLTALSDSDSTAVKPLWNRSSLRRNGFWIIHNLFHPWGAPSDWRTNVQGGKFEVQAIDREKDHVVLQVLWVPPESTGYQPRSMRFHVIRENEQWVFINPIDLFTRDWETYDTEHIRFHYPPQLDIGDYLEEIGYAESECTRALQLFGIRLDQRIDFYRAGSDVECGRLMNFGPVHGYAPIPRSVELTAAWDLWFVASSSFINHHELIHLIAGKAGIPDVNPAITEGLACAFAGAFHSTRDFILNDARNQILQSIQFPLEVLLTMDTRTFLRNNFITYSQAGSFIRYLHDRYGMQQLITWCSLPPTNASIITALEATYQQPLAQLEQEWIEYLLAVQMPEIGTTIPAAADPVFSMSDPAGDDTGDGDYAYPARGDYPEGCFDLRKFEVLKDDTRACFRLEFSTLKTPLVLGSQPNAEQFVVGCIIAIQKGDGPERHRQKFCHGIRFAGTDGYDCKVNVGTGVSLTNNFGETIFASPQMVGDLSKYETNVIEFSIPFSLIGEPLEDWKYFVGTCLMSDRVMNFLGEPLRVYEDPPIPLFISGGNYDLGNPPYMDILLPPAVNQSRLLSTYAADESQLPVVPMVGREENSLRD